MVCNQGADTISVKTNNANTTIDISSNGISTYVVETPGTLAVRSNSDINFSNNLLRVVGDGPAGTIFMGGDLRSTAPDYNYPDQILTREQNDARYLSTATTNLATIAPPDASVSFGG